MTTLQDRSILVIGATGDLGASISRRLASEGALLTLHGRDSARLESMGLAATVVTGDLRDADTATRAVEAAVAAHGRLDGVVIASGVVAFGPAGRAARRRPARPVPDQHPRPDPGHAGRPAAPRRLRVGGPRAFRASLSAVVAEQPTAGMAAYSASKAALTAYDAAAGRELRRAGIRLIDARPPHTETGLADRPLAGTAPRLPQGLTPDAVAARVVSAVIDDEKDLPSSAFGVSRHRATY